ncbi:unnamed protein product [Dovyalis caffra]|uniref:Mitochondrial import inner membrane translocase subunit TIM50 n=1 Tax=Dovyalis caffra TaxID=77055 RepID=A0AAV1SPG0_9ROSI|nr:unnamed protein product [Dovyalis caffra]
METTKEAPEVPSLQKRKARQRNRRKSDQKDSDPARKQSEEGHGNNQGGSRSTFFAKKKSKKKRKRNSRQDSDPAHKQSEEGGLPSTYNLNNVSTVCLSDEKNKELVCLADNCETKLVNKGMETMKKAPEIPSLQKRKARRRKRRNNQQDSDQSHKQAEEGGLLSTYNLKNVSTVCISDERNREVVFLSDNGETKLENKGRETTKEALEVPSLPKRKARQSNRRINNQRDSEPAHKQDEECGLPSNDNLNNVSTVCLSDERNREVVFLSDRGEIKLANKGTETTKEDPEVPPLQKRKARRRNRRRNDQQDSDQAHKQAEEGSLPSTYSLNYVSTVSLSDERKREAALLSDNVEAKLVSLAICDKENVPSETLSRLLDLRGLWEKDDAELPWDKGDYSESNTLLLDDSPYKALLNPAHTAIFPYPYHFQNRNDNSLGAGGDLRVYLEELAAADNVQEFVEHHPFGQQAISERSANWGFYLKAIRSVCPVQVIR